MKDERLPEAIDINQWAQYKREVAANNRKYSDVALKEYRESTEKWQKQREADKADYEARLKRWEDDHKAKRDAYNALPWYRKLVTEEPSYWDWSSRPEDHSGRFMPNMFMPFYIKPTVEGFYDWLVEKKSRVKQ